MFICEDKWNHCAYCEYPLWGDNPTHSDKNHTKGSTENTVETDVQRHTRIPVKKKVSATWVHINEQYVLQHMRASCTAACYLIYCAQTAQCAAVRRALGETLVRGSDSAELTHTQTSSSCGGPSVSRPALIGCRGTRAFSLEHRGALTPHPTPRSCPLVHWIHLLSDAGEAVENCLNTCVL